MNLKIIYNGSEDPFEGDRTIWLRNLPLGARALRATVKVMRLDELSLQFEETFDFNQPPAPGNLRALDWGVTKRAGAGFVEVDFHARRTLAEVTGSDLEDATLQVDVGGTFIDVNGRGALGGSSEDLLKLLDDTSNELPGLAVNKLRLSKLATSTPTVNAVTIRSVPTNITARLGQTPPFWVRVGELPTADTSPDFAEVLNAFVATGPKENGFYQIPLVLHSDTLARTDVELNIDYVLEQVVLPPHLPEVTLPYNFSTLPGVDEKLTTVGLPRRAIPVTGRSTAQIRGEFQPTRVQKGNIGEEPRIFPVRVAPDCSLAQAFQSEIEIALTGIDLPLANTQTGLSGMNITLQADSDGKPFGEVLIRADVRVEKPLPGQSSWGSATLSTPFRILPGVRYWLVLQSLIGEAYWNTIAGTLEIPTLQCSRDGGLSWRAATVTGAPALLSALFRLRDQPDRFSIPVQLQIGKGPSAVRRRLDEYAPLGRIDFNFDFAAKLAEHLNKPELGSPCGTGELLVNGGFDEPPHDDATQRLFGRENANGLSQGIVDLSRGVDLSVERFLTVSVDNKSPIWIDCAGANPSKTSLSEIITAAKRAARREIFEEEIAGNARFLAIRSDVDLQILPWCRLVVPTSWQGEPGRIIRLKRDGHVLIALVAPPAILENVLACMDGVSSTLDPLTPAELAQTMPIGGGCQYQLRFIYHYAPFEHTDENEVSPALARWQIEWRDETGQTLATDGATLIVPQDRRENISNYETRISAPAGAVEAELRFIQPPTNILILEDASLTPALETLTNAFFQFWEQSNTSEQELPQGWTLKSGRIEAFINGALLMGTGPGAEVLPDDSVLMQNVEVVGGQTYTLYVRGRPEMLDFVSDSANQPAQERARLELYWLFNGNSVDSALLPLDGRDFPTHAWSGVAPAGAKQAEVRLIQPKGRGNLFVESVSLMQVDLVNVPLIFLAETPGELTVSNLKVTYNLLQPPEEAPSEGFPQERSAMARLAGISRTDFAAQPTEAAPVARIEIDTIPRESPLARMPAAIVSGVGERFSKTLNRLRNPVKTIADLAARDLEADTKTIPRERRFELKTAAEMILAIDLNVEPFGALEQESLEELLTMPPEALADQTGQPIVPVEQLQRGLRALRLLIKNDAFRNLHLEDLMPRQD